MRKELIWFLLSQKLSVLEFPFIKKEIVAGEGGRMGTISETNTSSKVYMKLFVNCIDIIASNQRHLVVK